MLTGPLTLDFLPPEQRQIHFCCLSHSNYRLIAEPINLNISFLFYIFMLKNLTHTMSSLFHTAWRPPLPIIWMWRIEFHFFTHMNSWNSANKHFHHDTGDREWVCFQSMSEEALLPLLQVSRIQDPAGGRYMHQALTASPDVRRGLCESVWGAAFEAWLVREALFPFQKVFLEC